MTSFKINTNKLLVINGVTKVRSTSTPTTTTTTAAPTTTTTTTTPPPATFSYVYKILNLTYIDSINNDIYDLEYDLL